MNPGAMRPLRPSLLDAHFPELKSMDMPNARPLIVAIALLFAGAALAADADAPDHREKMAGNGVAASQERRGAQASKEMPKAGDNATQAASGVPAAIVPGARYLPGARLATGMPVAPVAPVSASNAGAKVSTACNDAKNERIYLKTLPDGSVELSNVPDGDPSDPMAIDVPCGGTPSEPPQRPAESAAAAPPADSGAAPAAGPLGGAAPDDALKGTGNSANADGTGVGPYAGLPYFGFPTGSPHRPSDPDVLSPPPADPQQTQPRTIKCERVVETNPVYQRGTYNPTNPVIAVAAPRGRDSLLAGANPALSRRYLMMDRAMYQQTVASGSATSGAQTTPASSGTQTVTITVDGSVCPAGWVPAT